MICFEKTYKSLIFLLVFLTVWSTTSIAQHNLKLEIVKDINPYGDSTPSGLLKLGDSIYYSAWDGVNGRELWVSDGTTAGTQMLVDVKPGPGAGVQYVLYKTDDKFFFIGDDGIHGQELWVSDGTSTGTFMLNEINTGTQPYSNYNDATLIKFQASVGDKLYFTANDGVHGHELWVSNGTNAGTFLIKDINPVPFDISYIPPTDAVSFNNLLYFNASDSVHGFELWVTDGTEIGTYLVKDINPGTANGFPNSFYAYNGNIFFIATDSLGGELWSSDGSPSGTNLIKDLNINGDSNPQHFYGYNDNVYFSAVSNNSRIEFYVTDGSEQGTQILKILDPDIGCSPSRFMEYEGELFFSAFTSQFWRELWSTDGTLGGTQLFIDFNSTPLPPPFFGETKSSYLAPIFEFENYLILSGDDGKGLGVQLWVMDENKETIMPINYEYKTFLPAQPTKNGVQLNGFMYFSSQYDSALGVELWRMYDSTVVSVEENKLKLQSNIKIYPNPNTGNLITIELNEIFKGTIQVEILDVSGRVVNRFELNQTNNQQIQIPTKNLKQGVYFMKVSGKNYQETVRFVKL